MPDWIQPRYLVPGDTVLVVASARKVTRAELHPFAEAALARGLQVQYAPNCFADHHQFAGTDAARLDDLNAALRRPDVHAVVFARGGYGTTRILDGADWGALRQHPKWLCGFSDLTAVLAAAAGQQVCSIHGPMAISYGMDVAPAHLAGLLHLLTGTGAPEWTVGHLPEGSRPGTARGRLIGGNLSLLAHQVGTPHAYDYRDAILLLEDLDEYRYHIDRMLTQLRRAGLLAQLAGVAVGSFSQLRDNAVPFGADAREMVLDAVRGYGYPVLFEVPSGHGRDNLPLVVGAETELAVHAGGAFLRQRLA